MKKINMTSESNRVYHEVQWMYRQQPLIMVVVVLIAAVAWQSFLYQVVMGVPFSDSDGQASDVLIWIIWIVFGLFMPWFFCVLRLEIEVTPDNLVYRYWPMHFANRTIPRSSISLTEASTYRPLRDFGGWGLRGNRRGKAYTVSGKEGVWVTRTDGRALLLGSQDAAKLAEALKGDGSSGSF